MLTRKVELLAPAGSPEALDAAIGEGADGVYLGLKSFNARLRSANFAYSQFEGALRTLHRMGRRLYVTVNTVFEEREADRLYQFLKYLAGLGPDGIIVQDFGVVKMVQEHFPALKLHASTQMNIASARAVNFLSKQGFSRAVLARELSLAEIQELRSRTNLELEVFVHGALCVSASGLCLFSSFLGGKSANRGLCTQACRRFYSHGGEAGGYYFSPADLQLIERIPDLAAAGVNSFKIEGRMKSAGYVGVVTAAYRRVIDSLGGDTQQGIQEALNLLRHDFARQKTLFFFDGKQAGDWLRPEQDGGTGIPLGNILKTRNAGGAGQQGLLAAAPVQADTGDTLRFHRADDSARTSLRVSAAVSEEGVWVSLPENFGKGDPVYLIQKRAMTRQYAPVIPRNLERFHRAPGRDRAPALNLLGPKKKAPLFPEGIYAGVSRIEDLYVVQSARPVKVILAYTPKTGAYLLDENKPPLPFRKEEIILALDPYFPQALEDPLGEELGRLREQGYYQFMINNPGHVSYFRNPQAGGADRAALLLAGPYLYTFNRWAFALVSGMGAAGVVSPLENNRQNLERTLDPGCRAAAFITLFAYPALFRIRANLGYGFTEFQDSRGDRFRLADAGSRNGAADQALSRIAGSLVIPERPFSIVDKIPFLREAGFSRFILDFSGPPLRKKDYKDVMAALESAAPLRDTSRFNWKDGFFQEKEP
jgi:putative protease